jgi:hypothetical protein
MRYIILALLTTVLPAAGQTVTQRLVPAPSPGPSFQASAPPKDCPFPQSKLFAGIVFTGRYRNYTTADTWYPSWASDGNLYSPWTDGKVGAVGSHSGPKRWTTGHAKIEGDDPLNLKVTSLGLHKAPAAPYGGRYPCGSLVRDGVWYYGTYCLDKKKYPWDIMGPFVGFRISKDFGKTWTDTPCTPVKPLFGESGKDGAKIKFGSPHFVDFGKNMRHSPDGKAYLTGHGATRKDAACSWISGDQIYLARVTPTIANVNDVTKYEFFAGRDANNKAIWTQEFTRTEPLLEWNDRMGCVTAVYNASLKKYLMCITDGGASGMGTYDTMILEADRITGPWKLAAFMPKFGQQAYFVNIPSKFISPDGRTMWLCFADDWVRKHPSSPAGTRYAMCLYEVRLTAPGDKRPKPPADPLKSPSNIAPKAKATASSSHPGYSPAGGVDGVVGGYPGDIKQEWASHKESKGAWMRLEWNTPQTINRAVLFDRPNRYDYITTGELTFSDGEPVKVGALPDDASAGREVTFTPRKVTWIQFTVTGVKTGYGHIGLAEFAVFAPKPSKIVKSEK